MRTKKRHQKVFEGLSAVMDSQSLTDIISPMTATTAVRHHRPRKQKRDMAVTFIIIATGIFRTFA